MTPPTPSRAAILAWAVALLIFALLATGCATTKTTTVPIPVTCTTKPVARPVFAFDALPLGSDIFTQVKTLLADRKERIAYERELETENAVCRS